MAGQTTTGGWTYGCPILTEEEEQQLLTALRVTRPANPIELFVPGAGGKPPEMVVGRPNPDQPGLPVRRPGAEGPTGPSGNLLPLPGEDVGTPGKGAETPRPTPEAVRRALNSLPARLRKIPALQPVNKSHNMPQWGTASDNSNTQFAVLALWAGGRHRLPLERSLALITRRFRTSQGRDGHWGHNYRRGGSPGTPAMTGAGLLLDSQTGDGSWRTGGYHGATPLIDTCLALLFLKRANLASDLSKKIEFVIQGKGERALSGTGQFFGLWLLQ